METSERIPAQPHGGRGARERILWAAAKLFYGEGINATGVNRLAEVAHVSKRTFYQHFSSKSALVEEYLRRFEGDGAPRCEQVLSRTDLTPRERLLSMFGDRTVRGCPFHNAAVEAAGSVPDVQKLVTRHKQDFVQRLFGTAREAGADDPESLGRQLAVLFEGAGALTTSLGEKSPLRDARNAAAILIDLATRTAVGER